MKVLIAGGGTAGHVNPALSIAQTIKARKPEAEIAFIGTQNGIESRLVPKAGFPIFYIDVHGLYRKLTLKNLDMPVKVIASTHKSMDLMREFQPDLVVGTGGYVSFPVISAALRLHIPTAIHEQNAFPGISSRLLAKKVDRILLGFETNRKYFPKNADVRLVGNPLRDGFLFANRDEARRKLGISDETFCVASFAGSLGAREFNRAMIEFMGLNRDNKTIKHIHATGKLGNQSFLEEMRENGLVCNDNLDVREYIDNMADVMAAADLVIGRAGANTLAEIMAMGKPSILVPSPNVTHNHQFYNAMSLVKNDAAIMIEEKDLSGRAIYDTVASLQKDTVRIKNIATNASAMAMPDSNQIIYDILCELA